MDTTLTRPTLRIGTVKTCDCKNNHINCLTAKEWLKAQLGVWQFYYDGNDIRDKKVHPATFPVSLARRVIELFSHQGELVLDPFVGSGTSLVAARMTNRNAVGFDLNADYVDLSRDRLAPDDMFNESAQVAIHDDAKNIPLHLDDDSVSLIWTSPPYANLLNRKRKNKSRRDRSNEQLGKVEQYSQDPRDLGTMDLDRYTEAMGDIFESLLPLLRVKGHCVVNVPDMWWENQRITIHVALIEELRRRGYELRNIIIWDRTNIVNRIGIFGWPSNYITMGTTFEYLLDFWRPAGVLSMQVFTKESLIEALCEIRARGWIQTQRPGNDGAVGNTLEDLLGLEENNLPLPNAGEWEIKGQRRDTGSLITLFHMEPSPRAFHFVPRVLLPYYGWPHKEAGTRYPHDEKSFRQTITAGVRTDRGFTVVVNHERQRVEVSFDASKVDGRHAAWLDTVRQRAGLEELSPQPYWGFKDLFHKAGTKLNKTIYAVADRRRSRGSEFFRFSQFFMLEDFRQERFLGAMESGNVLVDFDARTGHNHGTKFRLRQDAYRHLYGTVTEIECP